MIKISVNLIKWLVKAQNISVGYLFHPLVLYENYLICIFMNINENLKLRTKPLDGLVPQWVIRPTLNPKEPYLSFKFIKKNIAVVPARWICKLSNLNFHEFH